MYSGPHVIILGTSTTDNLLCLGVTLDEKKKWRLEVQNFKTSKYDQAWQLVPVPTNFDDTAYFLMHLNTGYCPHFGQDGPIPIEQIDPTNKEYLIRLEVVRDGYVSIANHNRSFVMNAKGDSPADGTPVIPYGRKRTNNELWIFVSTLLYGIQPR